MPSTSAPPDPDAVRADVLLVTNDSAEAATVQPFLRERGFRVTRTMCGDPAVETIRHVPFDVVLLCACAPGRDGIRTLVRARESAPDTRFIIMTEYDRVDTAVEAMRLGAFDYVATPIQLEALHVRVLRALEHSRLRKQVTRLQTRNARGCCGLVGNAPAMEKLYDRITRVAGTAVPVLLTGETGAGKELVARQIHQQSVRRQRPFIPVSCASLSATLLESQLFGHVKGSFTGAVSNRRGLVQEAEGGTLFLDEIETLDLALQAKLLRVVEEHTIQPVGGRHDVPVDFRLIAASNVPLEPLVAGRQFREDLFFRLNVFGIRVPALRERPSDIPLLAEFFRDRFAAESGLPAPPFSAQSLAAMTAYGWPGNVRELRHRVERAMILDGNGAPLQVELGDEGEELACAVFGRPIAESWSLARVEEEYIAAVLAAVNGNRSRAARVLGINRSTLYQKIGEAAREPVTAGD